MKYLSVADIAKKWNLSPRTVRNYCANGKIKGAFLTGKTWNIPEDSINPLKTKEDFKTDNSVLKVLREQKEAKLKGSLYHRTQIEFTYNTNHIEGSKLSEEQTRFIFETNTIGISNDTINIDDIIETTNHFKCIDHIIDTANLPLTESYIKELHFILKSGTSDSKKEWFNVGDYKRFPNEVGDRQTTSPENVSSEIKQLLENYKKKKIKTLKDIIDFHHSFETIHPFQDGNGRVGRLIMFKECLSYNIVPFIITEELKLYYYRGLKEYYKEPGFLIDTILTAQDYYKKYLDYFKIAY